MLTSKQQPENRKNGKTDGGGSGPLDRSMWRENFNIIDVGKLPVLGISELSTVLSRNCHSVSISSFVNKLL